MISPPFDPEVSIPPSALLSTQVHQWDVTRLSQEFAVHGYVKLPGLISPTGKLLFVQESKRME